MTFIIVQPSEPFSGDTLPQLLQGGLLESIQSMVAMGDGIDGIDGVDAIGAAHTDAPTHLNHREFYTRCRLRRDKRAVGVTCAVCLEPVRQCYRRISACRHVFHDGCLRDWLMSRSTQCPTCRCDARASQGV